jgi:PAS domain S-box-containing protein
MKRRLAHNPVIADQQSSSCADPDSRIRQLEAENARLLQLVAGDAEGRRLLSAERDLRSILDNMPSMIGYWDRDQRNRFGNHAYLDWFGVDPATMPGKHIREVIGEERYRLNLPYIEAALRGEFQQFERAIPSPDGKTLRHSLANYIPDIVNGEVLGFYVLVTDITATKQAEEALRISEARYREVIEDQTEVISRLRADGTLRFVNEVYCNFFGKRADELVGTQWMPVCHPEDLPHVQAQLDMLAPDHPVFVIENRVYTGEGRLRWMQFINRGFFDARGNLAEIQSVGRDITDRKIAEQALQDLMQTLEQRVAERTRELHQLAIETTLVEERERRAIARDLHDDLGQRLHIALLKLDALAKGCPEQASKLTSLRGEITGASQIVRSLISQLSPTVLRDLGLLPALRWLGEEMERQHGLAVEFAAIVPGPPALTEAQAAILFRAVRELLINVVRHAGTARARLAVELADGQLVIIVADRGVGLRTKHQGFGLASIRERLSFLGGSMKIDRRPKGGTRAVLTLPIT